MALPELTALPFATLPPPPYRPRVARWLTFAGISLIVGSFVFPAIAIVALGIDEELKSDDLSLALTFLFGAGMVAVFAVFLIGVAVTAHGRQLRALPAAELLRQDRRIPLLFLRSFDDDDLIDPTPRMMPMGDNFPRRYEESLASALRAVGPMLTIGRPGERTPLLGAGRLFVPNDAWQAAVAYLRTHTRAVILMVGRSPGIWWEITSCLESVPISHLLFFFPYVEDPGKRRSFLQRFVAYRPANIPLIRAPYRRMEQERQARYQLFRERVAPLVSQPLPASLEGALFLDFLADGTPRALKVVRPWWWPIALVTPSMRLMLADHTRTLRPFVDKLNA